MMVSYKDYYSLTVCFLHFFVTFFYMDNQQFNNDLKVSGADQESRFPRQNASGGARFNPPTYRYARFSDFWPLFLGVIPNVGPFIVLGFMIYWCASGNVRRTTPCLSNMLFGSLLAGVTVVGIVVVVMVAVAIIAVASHQ